MEEKNVLRKIADGIVDYAPSVAKYLSASGVGAPAGLAVEAVGALGKVFGLGTSPDPETLATAILKDPEARLKVMLAEQSFALEVIKQDTATILAVNATMQSEGKSEHWPQYSWRPFWGFASGTAFFFVCILVCILSWQAVVNKDASALGMIPLIIGAFATLFAIPGGILGIASWKRGQMQVESTKIVKEQGT